MSASHSRSTSAAFVLVVTIAFSSPAYAQSDGFSAAGYVVVGVVVVVAALAVISVLRRKSGKGGDASQPAAPNAGIEPAGPAPTLKSTMGLMSTQAEGPLAGAYFEIGEQGLTIGRDPEACDVVYDDERVSRQHARLEYTAEGLLLRNLSTTNQTFLNDEAVAEAVARSGDRIRIEQVTFRIYPHRGAAPSG